MLRPATPPPGTTIGWFGEDILDAASDVVDAAGSVLADGWDLVDDIPGFDLLGEGTKALFKGPLRDFAKSGIGQAVLRAWTTVYAMPIAGALGGSWLMMASASLPGIAAGDRFDEAILSENLWRLEQTAEYFGGEVAGELSKQLGTAIAELKKRAGEFMPDVDIPTALRSLADAAGVDLEAYAIRVARELGIREDFVVQAVELCTHLGLMGTREAYDVLTGKKRSAIGAAAHGAVVVGTAALLDRNKAAMLRAFGSRNPLHDVKIVGAAPTMNAGRVATLREQMRLADPAGDAARASSAAMLAAPSSGPSTTTLAIVAAAAVGAVLLWRR